MLAVALAFNSALLFALGAQLINLGLRHLDPQSGTLITIGASAAMYWLLSPLFVQAHFWLVPAVLIFATVGLFRPILSANLAVAGTRHLGPTLSTTLASTAPFFAAGLGVAVLGERLTMPIVVGTVSIVAGVMVISSRGRTSAHWPLWALLLPVGAALIRALANVFSKMGLEALPSPFFAGLVGYTVSLLLALVNAHRRGTGVRQLGLTPGSGWFVLAGVVNGLSVFSLNTALKHGQVVEVVPIVACSPLFSLILGLWFFRREVINARVLLAIMLVVPGVMLIAARAA